MFHFNSSHRFLSVNAKSTGRYSPFSAANPHPWSRWRRRSTMQPGKPSRYHVIYCCPNSSSKTADNLHRSRDTAGCCWLLSLFLGLNLSRLNKQNSTQEQILACARVRSQIGLFFSSIFTVVCHFTLIIRRPRCSGYWSWKRVTALQFRNRNVWICK